MRPRFLVLALSIALVAGPALAQTPISTGQTINGSLSASSPKANDGTPYDLYVLRGRKGERVRIRMESSAFDTYLAVGTVAAPGCSADCVYNDDGGGGTNSLLVATFPDSGELQIRANSIGATDAGPYTLSVTAAPPPTSPSLRRIAHGSTSEGMLSDDSPHEDDSLRPYDIWLLKGRGGQRVRIDLQSSDFDPMLGFGTWSDGGFLESASDDDGGAGLNSRLTVELPPDGEAAIRVSAVNVGATGRFTLTVGDPPAPRPVSFQTVGVGQAVRGRLDDNDPFTPDEEFRFDAYRIEGSPGQRVEVRMDSGDFDPVLRWGVFEGETFQQETMDDDGGGGTSARLVITLDAEGLGRLVATTLDGRTGGYTLALVSAARNAQ